MKPFRFINLLNRHVHYFLVLLLFMPVFLMVINLSLNGTRTFYLLGDDATLETRVVNAGESVQYLGPYSRFGWNHPGPMYFYLLLPFYKLFSGGTQALYIGAAIINLLSILIILHFTYRNEDIPFFYFIGFCLALFFYYYLGLNVLRNIWNPLVTMLPFTAFFVVSHRLSMGKINALPWIAVFASFVIQTHIAYAPMIAVLLLLALGLYVTAQLSTFKLMENIPEPGIKHKIKHFFPKDVRKSLVITAIILLILWSLPLAEALMHRESNVRATLRFFLVKAEDTHTLSESLQAVSRLTNGPIIKTVNQIFLHSGNQDSDSHVWLFGIQVVLLIGALVINHYRKKKHLFNFLLFGGVGLLVALISVSRISGPIYDYLIRWLSIIGFFNWCAIGFTFFSSLWALLGQKSKSGIIQKILSRWNLSSFSQFQRRSLIIIFILFTGFLSYTMLPAVSLAGIPKMDVNKYRHIGDISTAIKTYVKNNNITSFLLEPEASLWPTEAGVVNELYKDSLHFVMKDKWLFMYGWQFQQKKDETVKDILLFVKEKKNTSINITENSSPNHTLVYRSGECAVYHLKNKNLQSNQ